MQNKKTYVLLGLFIFSIISIVFIISKTKNSTIKTPVPTNMPNKTINWDSLTPGTSSINDIVDVLGTPIKKEDNKYLFQSSSDVRKNEVIIENEAGYFFKEIVTVSDKKKVDDITNKYGLPENTLYGESSINGYNLYVYPDNGIAYLGNLETRTLLEIWHFQPTDIKTFINKWANNYSFIQPKGTF